MPCHSFRRVLVFHLQRHRLIIGPFNNEVPTIKPIDGKWFARAYRRRPRSFRAMEALCIKAVDFICATTPSGKFVFLLRYIVSSTESVSGYWCELAAKRHGNCALLICRWTIFRRRLRPRGRGRTGRDCIMHDLWMLE